MAPTLFSTGPSVQHIPLHCFATYICIAYVMWCTSAANTSCSSDYNTSHIILTAIILSWFINSSLFFVFLNEYSYNLQHVGVCFLVGFLLFQRVELTKIPLVGRLDIRNIVDCEPQGFLIIHQFLNKSLNCSSINGYEMLEKSIFWMILLIVRGIKKSRRIYAPTQFKINFLLNWNIGKLVSISKTC